MQQVVALQRNQMLYIMNAMKGQKKELAAAISESVQGQLDESAGQAGKLKKEIKKTAKKLAEQVIKIAVKEEKKAKKAKKDSDSKTGPEKKKDKKTKISAGLHGVDSTEREALSAE